MSPPPPPDSAPTLLDHLRTTFPNAKTQTLKRMVEAGRVRVNGRPARKLKQALVPGEQVTVADATVARPRPSAASSRTAKGTPLRIVYEDEDLLVVDKPAGLLTSTVPREPRVTLLAQVRTHVATTDPRARIGLVHRLDR